jgi:hypothetical protein
LRCFSQSQRIHSAPVNATDRRFFLIDDDMLFQASFVCQLRESVIGRLLDQPWITQFPSSSAFPISQGVPCIDSSTVAKV